MNYAETSLNAFARVRSVTCIGLHALGVDIEVQIVSALRRFSIVGLPDGVLRESKERVRCAIENSGVPFPEGEVIVSLGPASIKKYGSGFDLPIAVGILAAQGVLRVDSLEHCIVVGELALDGGIKMVPGVLLACHYAKEQGFQSLIIPAGTEAEASLIDGVLAYSVDSLAQCIALLRGERTLEAVPTRLPEISDLTLQPTFSDVVGQHRAKRALEVAAAGGHHLLMIGPPGAGKSMLATRLPSILPALTPTEVIEVTKVYSVLDERRQFLSSGQGGRQRVTNERPVRAPHHSISAAGLFGGGSEPMPGEISLAHKGVLFLDEFPEFRRDAIEALRQPLESREVEIGRARLHLTFPADFLLVVAMNPCPCGKRGLRAGNCQCSRTAIARYRSKVSAPLLDRIDLQLWVAPVPVVELGRAPTSDTTAEMRSRVERARDIQRARYGSAELVNGRLAPTEMKQFCKLEQKAKTLLQGAAEKFELSARGWTRVLKVSRTIADLEASEQICASHVSEALSYRLVDVF